MQILSDYIHPLMHWIEAHPTFSLFITFSIAVAESIILLGGLIPGAFIMAGIGIIAGTGVMRKDLTLLASTLGAIIGDFASYSIGYFYSERISGFWPFSRHPNWLLAGKVFFAKHGGKSILIGRFIGPLRAITPLVAGVMHMSRTQFILFNVLSALCWSLVYVVPGILIGMASNELSPSDATRLAVLFLVFLASAWVITRAIFWISRSTKNWIRNPLHLLWLKARQLPLIDRLTPSQEKDHFATALLTIGFIGLSILTLGLMVYIKQWSILSENTLKTLILPLLHSPLLDKLSLFIAALIAPLPLFVVLTLITAYSLWNKNWQALVSWLAASAFVIGSVSLFYLQFTPFHPMVSRLFQESLLHLAWSTNLFCFLMVFLCERPNPVITLIYRILLLSILILAGLSSIYQGIITPINALLGYLIGLSIFLAFWLFLRVNPLNKAPASWIIPSVFLLLVLTTVMTIPFVTTPSQKPNQIKLQQWWFHASKQPLIDPINIQYAGNIKSLERTLTVSGWKKQSHPILHALLVKASGRASLWPLFQPLYHNKKPDLTLICRDKPSSGVIVLRFWKSNYYLDNSKQPIWMGSSSIINHSPPKGHPNTDPIRLFKKTLDSNNQKFKTKTIVQTPSSKATIPASRLLLILQINGRSTPF
jgi:membrane protein DedA with SNARE-associated domain